MMLTSLATLTLLAPQGPTSPLMEHALVVQDATLGYGLFRVPEADVPGGPVPLSSFDPRFAMSSMFPNYPPGKLTFGSFSSGTSEIVPSGDEMGSGGTTWGYLYFTVSSIAACTDPTLAAEYAAGIDGDTFSFVLPGSEIAGDYVGIVEKVRDGSAMGISSVRGLDQNLAAIALLGDIGDEADEETLTFYFTLTPASLPAASQSWFGSSPKSAATVLMMTWQGSWSAPTVRATYDDLGLDELDVVTGLAIEPIEQRLLIATTNAERKLWYVDLDSDWQPDPTTPVPGPYLARTGPTTLINIADGILGLGPNHIKGLCSTDPGSDPAEPSPVTMRWNALPMSGQPFGITRPCYNFSVTRTNGNPRTNRDYLTVLFNNLGCLQTSQPVVMVTIDGAPSGPYFPQTNDGRLRVDILLPNGLPPWDPMLVQGFAGRGLPVVPTHVFSIWP